MNNEQKVKVEEWLNKNWTFYNKIKDGIRQKDEVGEDISFEEWEDHDYYENTINGFLECLLIIEPEYYTGRPNGEVQGEEEREV